MTPQQARATAALMMIRRLVRHHGLTVEDAVTAVVQRTRGEAGEHTHLVTAEAAAILAAAMAPIRAALEAMQPALAAAVEVMAVAARQLQATAPTAAGRRTDRPAWVSPYGPPSRHR